MARSPTSSSTSSATRAAEEGEAHQMDGLRKEERVANGGEKTVVLEGEEKKEFTGHGVEDMKIPWSYYIPFIGRTPTPPPPPASFDDSPLTPEVKANIISRHVFQWIQPLLILGSLRPLEFTDCYRLDPTSADSALLSAKLNAAFERRRIEADEYNARLDRGEVGPGWMRRAGWMVGRGEGKGRREKERIWRERTGRKTPSLVLACNEVMRWRFWAGGIYKLVGDSTQMLTPLVIKYIIRWVAEKDAARRAGVPGPDVGQGVGAAIGLFLMLLVASLGNHSFFYHGTSTGVLLRGGLIASIYERSLKLTGKARAEGLSAGHLVNFVSTDVSRIDFACGFFFLILVAPVQMIICLILLCINLGPAALAGFAFFCFVTPLQTRAMKLLFSQRLKAMVYTDQRARLISELLGGIKLIKFFAWEMPYIKRLNILRTKELSHIKTLLIVRGANMAIAFTLPVLASVISFLIYGAQNGGLTAADVFASLSLFQLLRMPLMMLPLALSSSVDAHNAFSRLTPLFLAETLAATQNIDPTSELAISVRDATFRWETPPPEKETSKSKSKLKAAAKQDRKDEKAEAKAARKAAKAGEDVIVNASTSGAGENDAVMEDVAPGEGKVPGLKEVRNAEGEGMGKDRSKEGEKEVFSMAGVNLAIPKGSLTAIVGSVGCGKSSLLQGLIGEMARTSGDVVFNGSIGYVPQNAWLASATIRDNILFGRPFDEERYWAAVRAASLEADLETLPGGDGTAIGEKGINLSGGQRQRVSMARVLYFDAEIILLDDPLSAVDAHVGRNLFTNAICGALGSKTRLLVTHQIHFLPEVDYIITLAQGVIAEQGTYAELREKKGAFSKLMDEFTSVGEDEAEAEKEVEENAIEEAGKPQQEKAIDRSKLTGKKGDTLIVAEERYTGAVGFGIVQEYFRAANGKVLVPILILMVCLSQVATVLASYMLVWWQEDYFGIPIGGYMAAYAGLAIAQALFTFFMGVAFAYITYYASVSLHRSAIARVLRAPSSFYDTTPLGRIQNRLGKDMDTIDNQLGDGMRMLVSTLSQILGSIILVAVVSPWFLIAAAAVLVLLYIAASFYRASARELKRIDSILRSTLYSHFGESLTGLATIRAYGEQKRFLDENAKNINLENRAYMMSITIQRWLGPRVDLLGNLLALCVSFVSLFSNISPSQSGLILGYVVGLVQSFAWLVRQVAEVENDSTSAERILHYANHLEVEAPAEIPETAPSKEWPQRGAIKFEKVSMAYRPGLPNVLKNVSFDILPGEKIGICGRTGAGKSTIMTALFRLVEINQGTIEVDGLDISKLGLNALRQGLSIIPQEALLVSGTIRSNLDPFSEMDDATLNDALRRSYLIDTLDSPSASDTSPNGGALQSRFTLDTVVEDEGSNLSVGQRSLVSLARALAKDAKVVVLDEATASVDFETDSKIQETIRKHFKQKTLLCIAHRLKTIIGYNRILVMDKGEIAEFDTPSNLYKDENGLFRGMLDKSGLKWEDLVAAEEQRLADDASIV